MADWSINISQPAGGQTQFSPDPLAASINDCVSWANRTDAVHQIAISGVTFTEPIQPFTSSKPTYVCQGTAGSSISYKCITPGHTETGTIKLAAFLICALLLGLFGPSLKAQSGTPIDCSSIVGTPLQPVPEISARSANILKGTLVTAGANVRIPFVQGGKRVAGSLLKPDGTVDPTKVLCFQQWVRAYSKDAPRGSQDPGAPVLNPLPGPTIRGRVGDLIELTFLNLIDPLNFPRADIGKCDEFSTVKNGAVSPIYPIVDKYPDCFNESINTNVHYHGTHTNPSTTGDNVFLQIKPSPRAANASRTPAITAASVQAPFNDFYSQCEAQLPSATVPKQWPRLWLDAPKSFRDWADQTVQQYAPEWYRQNQNAIANGAWPQYYVGAVPYCYRLPDYTSTTWPPAPPADMMSAHAEGAGAAEMDETQAPQRPLIMGQAPGTHWYHAHKHGSTTINVSNGMTGVFIIEGKYDDEIKAQYPGGIKQQVLVVQQLGGTSFLERGAGGADPYFAVNGQLQPVIAMRPGEVQWWRIANTSSRAGAYFLSPARLKWKQLAQDGVQFNDTNYQASNNNPFLLASGNRADLLVQAPAAPGTYSVLVNNTVDPADRASAAVQLTLLNVVVSGTAANMQFLSRPLTFPPYLVDIKADAVKATRELRFSSSPNAPIANPAMHKIDGKLFDGEVGAAVVLNQIEEWKIVNETYPKTATATGGTGGNRISHPFHIHINPFQVVEIFDPTATVPNSNPARPVYVTSSPGAGQCLINLNDPTTWKPCSNVPAPSNIWWDVFSIPSGGLFTNGTGPAVKVPGYFKMRSRFVDYAGYYVLHCHILAHEDRGMMTVVYVTPLQPPFSHH
ncbi:MAG TPA: multicopper oxidase domain-containing protein [Thermoanaerobaculia bacterium]|jgi:FtsP/CotA-like multicopper oxidase with cupredoxin domain|nr:multicopper oxidase domain-containing protein [Thermoanaerobaculia bacterium]